MFIVIAFMFSGIIIGYMFRNVRMNFVQHILTLLIWVLLLLLGIEVGENKDIIKALPTLGAEAIAITIAGLLGSLTAAWLLWRHISKGKGGKA